MTSLRDARGGSPERRRAPPAAARPTAKSQAFGSQFAIGLSPLPTFDMKDFIVDRSLSDLNVKGGGELKDALARHADAVFSTLSVDEQRAFPLVMRHLVRLGQGEEEVSNRRTVPYRDFLASGETDQDQKAGARGFVGTSEICPYRSSSTHRSTDVDIFAPSALDNLFV